MITLKCEIPTGAKILFPCVSQLNRSAELFRCDEIHLKLLTDRSFQDTSQQLNTLAFRV